MKNHPSDDLSEIAATIPSCETYSMPNHARPDELADLRRRVEHAEHLLERLADRCHLLDMQVRGLNSAIHKLREGHNG